MKMQINDNIAHEYEMYVDECNENNINAVVFKEWIKYYEHGELYLLDKE